MKKSIAVKINNISKVYKLYDKPVDRIKESLNPFGRKYHKEFYALKNINLEIKKGEILGIVGVNGAGKSTLLKIIAKVMTPTKGRVTIRGKVNAILELSSGLKKEMTGRENIHLNLKIDGTKKGRKKLAEAIIEFADIGDHIDQPVKTYSSGMKTRLGFAITTSTDPDVLIVDEVLAVGDALFQRKCYAKIEKLFKDGKTVIFVSHSTQSIVKFCSRAILLYDREIVLDGTPKEVTEFYQRLIFSNDHEQLLKELKGDDAAKEEQSDGQVIKKDVVISRECYLPDLKADPVEYRNFDVDIFDVMILDEKGEKVNVLDRMKRYVYTLKVRFNNEFENVSFGYDVKTCSGTIVSSIESVESFRQNKYFKYVAEGSVFTIQYPFVANLMPGMYFTNNGVSSFVDKQVVLNRIVDVLAFKVNESNSVSGGYFQLVDEDGIRVEKQ